MNSLLINQIPKEILFSIKTIDFNALNAPTAECTRDIDQLLKRTVLVGGKRLRPLLTLLMGRLFGLSVSELKDHAKAIECIHGASLAHDDVVDNAKMRRGHPSINSVAGNKKSVLAGDYLLSSVIVTLSEKGNVDVLKKTADVISMLAQGEWIQHECLKTKTYTKEAISNIAKFKTASVMSWCCVIPSMINGMDKKIVNLANLFGENLGIAFQEIDDTLDFSKDSQKDFLLDFHNGVINSVIFEWMELNSRLKEDFKNETLQSNILNYDHLEEALTIVKKDAQSRLADCHSILSLICEHLLEKESELNKTDKIENIKRIKSSKKAIKAIIEFISNRSY